MKNIPKSQPKQYPIFSSAAPLSQEAQQGFKISSIPGFANQKQNFFNQLKFLYQLKGLNLRIYKLDDKIDLNANKDYYNRLMEEFANDEEKLTFLKERYDRLEILEEQNLTTTSRYYFVLISDNDKALEHTSEELEMHCYNMTPRLHKHRFNMKTILSGRLQI